MNILAEALFEPTKLIIKINQSTILVDDEAFSIS